MVEKATFNRIFLVLFMAMFISTLGMGLIGPFLPVYVEQFGATGFWIGLVFAMFSTSRSIFMPIIGKASDKKGKKFFISLGLFIYAILSLGYVFSNQVYQLGLVRFFQGMGSAMVWPVAVAYLGEITPKGREGVYMGRFNMSFSAAMAIAPFIGGFMKDYFGINFSFYSMGALSGFGFWAFFSFCRRSENIKREKRKQRNLYLIERYSRATW